jgi:hypothetical protein
VPYYITGTLTFSSQANRNSARTAVDAVSLGGAQPWAGGPYAAGIANVGTTQMTISLVIDADDAAARVVARALLNAYSAFARNAGHLAIVRGGS